MVIKLDEMHRISVGATQTVAIDYTDWLDSGELLTGTPTASEQTTSDLTISSISVSTGSLTIKGRTVATAAAVYFSVSGGTTANSPYTVRVTATSDATPSRTEPFDIQMTWV